MSPFLAICPKYNNGARAIFIFLEILNQGIVTNANLVSIQEKFRSGAWTTHTKLKIWGIWSFRKLSCVWRKLYIITCFSSLAQLLGDNQRLNNSMEFNAGNGWCILCVRKTPISSSTNSVYHRYRRLGTFFIDFQKYPCPNSDAKTSWKWWQVLSFLSLAAACSTASVADFMITEAGAFFCGRKLCSRYQLSAAMAFLSWCLSIASALFNLWLLPSLF